MRWLNLLVAGKAYVLLAPWLYGAPLTALIKPDNKGFRPIAVETAFIALSVVSAALLSIVRHLRSAAATLRTVEGRC